MSILNFPTNPAPGTNYTLGNVTYVWSGSAWLRSNSGNQTFNTVTATNTITVGTGTNVTVVSGGTITINGVNVVTTASVLNALQAGTDISINTSTGVAVISNTSTLQSVTNRGNSTTNAILIFNTASSISTTTGALTVAGGVGIGGSLWVNSSIYSAGAQVLTTASFRDVSTLQSVTDLGNTTTNAIIINNLVNSTSTTTGALVVTGGVGIGGDVRVGGDLYTTNLEIADTIFDSTAVLVNTTGTVVVDSYSANEFRSAKYLIQIDEGSDGTANFEVLEILLLIDNIGTVYATEYGLVTSSGELGEFAADVGVDNRVRLYFTAYDTTDKTIKVLRTAMTV